MTNYGLDDLTILYSTPAHTLEVGDQIIVDGDYITIVNIKETDDIDEVVVAGVSMETGDREVYSLYADDEFEVWTLIGLTMD
jgi:hypothetical protein